MASGEEPLGDASCVRETQTCSPVSVCAASLSCLVRLALLRSRPLTEENP